MFILDYKAIKPKQSKRVFQLSQKIRAFSKLMYFLMISFKLKYQSI